MIHKQTFAVNYSYEVHFTQALFELSNPTFHKALTANSSRLPVRFVVVIDDGVLACHPELINKLTAYSRHFVDLQLASEPMVLPGGEGIKNDFSRVFECLNYLDEAKIDRHSFLIAIGGGALLDMAGFAAAVGHRGVKHIRIPTTVLSQNDSAVGVKNGVNFNAKKNFIGTFAPPESVLCDADFLTTLSDRDWRSGIPEAIKVSLLKDPEFYEWIEQNAAALNHRNLQVMTELVQRCAVLHMEHISSYGDPFEKGTSRPLDFGHWAAHKLEQLTDFELRHGEAVAIGLALDNIYAWKKGMLPKKDCDRILDCLDSLGFSLYHPMLMDEDEEAINPELTKGLEEFREHLGGQLTIMLLEGIGKPREVHSMDYQLIEESVLHLKAIFHSSYADPS